MKRNKINIDKLFEDFKDSKENPNLEEKELNAIFQNLANHNRKFPYIYKKSFIEKISGFFILNKLRENRKLRNITFGLAGGLAVIFILFNFLVLNKYYNKVKNIEKQDIIKEYGYEKNNKIENSEITNNQISIQNYTTISLENNTRGQNTNYEDSQIAFNCIQNELSLHQIKFQYFPDKQILESDWIISDSKLLKLSFKKDINQKLINIQLLSKFIDNDSTSKRTINYKVIVNNIKCEIQNKIRLLN